MGLDIIVKPSIKMLREQIRNAKEQKKPRSVIEKLEKRLAEKQNKTLTSVEKTPLTPKQQALMTRLSKSKTTGVKKLPPAQT